jgi:uncharacterized protein
MSVARPTPRVGVIGSGIAGLSAAHACVRAGARVTLYEADDRLGGHADTHEVLDESAGMLAIDTGFIVHNERTYPVLLRMFRELGVGTQASEMSMSMADDVTGVEWAGARGLRGLFPSWRRLADRDHWRMLAAVPRFHRAARRLLAADEGAEEADLTLGDFLRREGFDRYFVRHFMEPLVAAVWSCDPVLATQYPARYLFRFLDHHGMLSVTGSPSWRTVTGGSREYVRRVAAEVGDVRTGTPVLAVREAGDGVVVTEHGGREERFDRVVVAVHPDQALALLPAATPLQREVLGAIAYPPNTAVLHTDTALMPASRSAWSSWNFRRRSDRSAPVTITYDLTRLQRLPTTTRYLVTLGAADLVDPAHVLATMSYAHPLYTPASVAAQRRLAEIDTDRIAFAGAYHGWGFHEDGARSGLAAARRLGVAGPAAPAAVRPGRPEVYATEIRHTRRRPWRRAFRHRSRLWVVDLDDLPRRRGWRARLGAVVTGSIEARDHLGDPGSSLRDNLASFLRGQGVELGEARVRLAAHPRAFGLCFNPISVFWCTAPDGELVATVVEVHNTYGDRHAYLLRPEQGSPQTLVKQMYVSPFHGVDGHYRVSAPPPGDRLDLAVSLHTADGAVFSASLQGHRISGGLLAAALAGARDAALIRLHGVALWARGLPVQPRPVHHQEGVR